MAEYILSYLSRTNKCAETQRDGERQREICCLVIAWLRSPWFPFLAYLLITHCGCLGPILPIRTSSSLIPHGLHHAPAPAAPPPSEPKILKQPPLSQKTRPSLTAIRIFSPSATLRPVSGSHSDPSRIHFQRRYARSSLSRGRTRCHSGWCCCCCCCCCCLASSSSLSS